jgi:hypothetical protein
MTAAALEIALGPAFIASAIFASGVVGGVNGTDAGTEVAIAGDAESALEWSCAFRAWQPFRATIPATITITFGRIVPSFV